MSLDRIRFRVWKYKLRRLGVIFHAIINSVTRWCPVLDFVRTLFATLTSRNRSRLLRYLDRLDSEHGTGSLQQTECVAIPTDMELFVAKLLDEAIEGDDRFRSRIIPTGSFYQGSKIGPPNEFDFTILMTELGDFVGACCDMEERDSKTVVMITKECPNRARWEEFLKEDSLNMEKVIAKFIELTKKSILNMNERSESFFSFGCFVGIKSSAIFCTGPSVSIGLTFAHSKGQYKFMKVSCDLCLAIPMRQKFLDKCRRVSLKALLTFPGRCLSEPLILVFNPHKGIGLSSAIVEHKILTEAHPGVKKAIRLLKIFREKHLPLQKIKSKLITTRGTLPVVRDHYSNKSLWEGLHTIEVKTYALKTLVYHELTMYPYAFQWNEENLASRILNLVDMLLSSLKGGLEQYFLTGNAIIHDYIFVNPEEREEQISDCATLLQRLRRLQQDGGTVEEELDDRFKRQMEIIKEIQYDPDRDE